MVSNESGGKVIAGIISFGVNDCQTSILPGIYTDVPKYVEWIKETVRTN